MNRLLPVASTAQAWRLGSTLLRRRPLSLSACLAAFALAGIAGLVAPWQLGRIVDTVSSAGGEAQVTSAAMWIAASSLVSGVSTWASVALLARVAEPALAELREEALDRALHLDTAVLEQAGSGDLLSRVGDDVRVVGSAVTSVVPLLMGSVVAIVFTSGGLFALDWRLGLAGLGSFPFYAAGLRWYLPRSGPFYRRERMANGDRAQAFLTGMHASRTLRALGIAPAHQVTVSEASWRSVGISLEVNRLLTRFGARTNRSELVGLLLILGTGFALVRAEAATVGSVTAAALFFHRLFNPIGAVLALFDEAQSAGASLTRLAGLALIAPTPPRSDLVPVAHTGLRIEGLGHAYAEGRAVLDDVSFTVPAGQRLAVVGTTGAGKSTLGSAVAGRLEVTRGVVRLGGVVLRDVASHDGRPTVAMVTQEVHVFAGTVRDNLTLGGERSDRDLQAALEEVGASAWVAALPDGVDTAVGDGASALTPAQAQQVALARVVLADPLVVVLDEATAEAGSAGARDLEQAALAATRGRTSLTIAHRLSQAASADQVLVLEGGKVLEMGSHHDLVAAGAAYARLWRVWTGG